MSIVGTWGGGDGLRARCVSTLQIVPVHSFSYYFKQLPQPAVDRQCGFVMKCLGLGSPSLAESQTAASASADAADFLLLPYVRRHYHIDELAVMENLIYNSSLLYFDKKKKKR